MDNFSAGILDVWSQKIIKKRRMRKSKIKIIVRLPVPKM
jgi:hypothetical protein